MIGSLTIEERIKELMLARRSVQASFAQKWFAWSLIILNLYGWEMELEIKLGIPSIVKYLLAVNVFASMIYMMVRRPVSLNYYGFGKAVVAFFCLYSFWLVAQTFKPEARYFQNFFGQKFFVLPFLIPVFLLFTKWDIKWLRYLFQMNRKMLVFSFLLILTVLATLNQDNMPEHIQRVALFQAGLPLVLLSLPYMNSKQRFTTMVFGYYILLLFLGAYYGRRGFVLYILLNFFFYYVLLTSNPFVPVGKKFRNWIIIAFSVVLFIGVLGTLKGSLLIFERGLDSTALEESRGSVFDDFYLDFSTTGDWFWGRGLEGRVLRTMDTENGGLGDIIENGYLFTILKAGGFYLLMQLFIFITAAYLGWARSKNHFTKGVASIIILHLIGMLMFGLPEYSAGYVMVWICVVLCYSDELRKMSDDKIRLILNL